MLKEYFNQVEAMLMQSDIEEGLGLENVQFTQRGVLAEGGKYLYLETEIMDADGYKTTHWIALNEKEGLIFADEQPEGVQKTLLSI